MSDSPEDPLLEQEQHSTYAQVAYRDIVTNFGLMGWTAFGGPQAHVALFETVCGFCFQKFYSFALLTRTRLIFCRSLSAFFEHSIFDFTNAV